MESLTLKLSACQGASSPSSQKVVLKSTTKRSLNDRFTHMLKSKQAEPVAASVRVGVRQQHVASVRNRRLVQQMENRPTVQAALQHKQSLKQRLGRGNIQARLGRPMGSLMRMGVGGRGFPMAGLRGMTHGGRGVRGLAHRGVFSPRGMSQMRGAGGMRRGMRQRGFAGGRAGARGGFRGGFGGRGRGGVVMRGRGGRGRGAFVARGRGRGAAGRPAVSREQLDNQLDAYMSKTKGHLDAELDAYMAQGEDME